MRADPNSDPDPVGNPADRVTLPPRNVRHLGITASAFLGAAAILGLLVLAQSNAGLVFSNHGLTIGALALALVSVMTLVFGHFSTAGATPARMQESLGRPPWMSPVAAWILMAGGVAGMFIVTSRLGRDSVSDSVRQRLEAIATLKASQIKAWIDDGAEDIHHWSQSAEFAIALNAWRKGDGHGVAARLQLLTYLWRVSESSHYVEIGIRDPRSGALLLTTTGEADSAMARSQAIKAASLASPILEDSPPDHDGRHDQKRFLGFFAAVTPSGGGSAMAVVHVGVDPEHQLFPLIEQGSAAIGSAVVRVVRRGDPSTELLSRDPPGFQNSTLNSHLENPGQKGLGESLLNRNHGLLRGENSRHEAIFVFAQPIAGTNWIVLVETEEAQAFAELNRIILLAAAMAAGLLTLAAWWSIVQRRQVAIERRFEVERAERAQQLALLSRRIVSVQEEERRRLAMELHDRTGGNLAAIQLNLKTIARSIPGQPPGEDDLMKETSFLLSDTIVSIREFCGELRPAILIYGGLAQAIKSTLAQFTRRTAIETVFDHSGFSGRFNPDLESVLFRIAQEALLNCAKHSRASRVVVKISSVESQLTLTIEDNGVGFDPDLLGQTDQDLGSGLLSMRERATFVGGHFFADSHPGQGTSIRVDLG
jgi:signal transduction histidine kinase